MLQEMDRELQMLTREEENISRIQDPSEIRGRRGRTLGKRGSRRHTAAEIVERELKRSDREAPTSCQQLTHSEALIIDLTSSSAVSQQCPEPSTASQHRSRPITDRNVRQRPFVKTLNPSRPFTRHTQRTVRPTSFTLSSSMPQDSDITVPDSWITDDMHALPDVPFNAPSNQPSSSLSSNTSSRTQHKRSALHETIVVQPFKRVRKENT